MAPSDCQLEVVWYPEKRWHSRTAPVVSDASDAGCFACARYGRGGNRVQLPTDQDFEKAAIALTSAGEDLTFFVVWLPRRQIDRLLRLQGVGARARRAAVAFWLFNPFTATISSRGSGEALVTVMLLHMLLCLFMGALFHLCGCMFLWVTGPGSPASQTLHLMLLLAE